MDQQSPGSASDGGGDGSRGRGGAAPDDDDGGRVGGEEAAPVPSTSASGCAPTAASAPLDDSTAAAVAALEMELEAPIDGTGEGGGGDDVSPSRGKFGSASVLSLQDDGLDGEERRLAAAEADLRAELDMAGNFGERMRTPVSSEHRKRHEDEDREEIEIEEEAVVASPLAALPPSSHSEGRPPGTRWVSLIFGLLGMGILLPWNAFISAEPYFHSRLCSDGTGGGGGDPSGDGGEPSGGGDGGGGGDADGVELWFGLVFNFSGFLALLAMLAFKRRAERRRAALAEGGGQVREGGGGGASSHARKLVLVSLTLYLTTFSITTCLVLLPRIHPPFFLYVTLLSLAVFGACLAVSGTGVIAAAGTYPPDVAVGPFFSGQSVGGVAVSVANFVAATAESPDKFWEEQCGRDDNGGGGGGAGGNDDDSAPPGGLSDGGWERYFPPLHRGHSADCLPYSTDWATFCYFLLGSALLVACIAAFLLLDRIPATVYYRRLARDAAAAETSAEGRRRREQVGGGGDDDDSAASGAGGGPIRPKELIFDAEEAEEGGAAAAPLDRSEDNDLSRPLLERSSRGAPPGEDADAGGGSATIGSVWRAIRYPALTLFTSAFVTLALFPAFTSKIESTGLCRAHTGRLRNDLFEPLTFLLFNVPDLLARMMAGSTDITRIRNLDAKVLAVSVGRFLLLPLFLLCNSSSSVVPYTVQNDLYPLALGVAFAFTNGLCMTTAFMCAPRLISPAEDVQELGSAVMNFALALGLLSGSCFSFVYNWIGTGQWV